MSAPGWAHQLGPSVPGQLTAAILSAAISPWVHPERLRAVLAARLDGNASLAVPNVVEDLARPPRPGARPPTATEVEHAARALLAAGACLLVVGHQGYPRRLANAWPELGAPAWLFARSPAPLPDAPTVAVVGTRRATLDGLHTARALGRFLGQRGIMVVSGMARGIDQAAHLGALDGGGRTVAVLGTGFGVDYPRRDEAVREAVATSGGLFTEYPYGTPVRAHQFLWRNRIVSGLADVTVVVEGQARSGALQTARLAAAQGREVFAVPGSLNAPTSRGPLDLVRDGARLVTAFEDVLTALDETAIARGEPRGRRAAASGLDQPARAVLDLLGPTPAQPDAVASAAGLSIADALSVLAELESRGLTTATARGFVATSG